MITRTGSSRSFPRETGRYRELARDGGKSFEGLSELEGQALDFITANEPVCAEELPLEEKIFWHFGIHRSGNRHGESGTARSVLELLYSTGELVIHHKKRHAEILRSRVPSHSCVNTERTGATSG